MSKFDKSGFYIKNNKAYKDINGNSRLITLLKPNYDYVELKLNEETFDMEDTENLLNCEIIKHIINNTECNLNDIDNMPHRIDNISEGLDLYAIDTSNKIWDFNNYDSWISVIEYEGIHDETNQLI